MHKQGMVYYVGAYLDDPAQQALIDLITGQLRIESVMLTPLGVEARKRVSAEGEDIVILINHTANEQDVTLPWPAHEHLLGLTLEGTVRMGPYGVLVLTKRPEGLTDA